MYQQQDFTFMNTLSFFIFSYIQLGSSKFFATILKSYKHGFVMSYSPTCTIHIFPFITEEKVFS
jgi:hypothetical protein